MDIIFSLILILLAVVVSYFGFMLPFMGAAFFVLGGLKIVDLKGFAKIFQTYDLFAKMSKTYAYIYPFIEIVLGLCFLARIFIFPAAIVTLVIMTIGSISIAKHLLSGDKTSCACLGAKINVPLTRFTLVEDIIMAIMAIILIIKTYL